MADLLSRGRQIIQSNWPLLGGFAPTVTYKSKAKSTYDANTGVVTPGAAQDFTLSVMIESFPMTQLRAANRQQDDLVVLSIERKMVFPAADLAVTPAVGDQVVHGPTIYRVIGVQSDPGAVPGPIVWLLHCRPLVES